MTDISQYVRFDPKTGKELLPALDDPRFVWFQDPNNNWMKISGDDPRLETPDDMEEVRNSLEGPTVTKLPSLQDLMK